MEVLFDLDEEAASSANKKGIRLHRVPTVGVHPRFVSMIRELIVERMTPGSERLPLENTDRNTTFAPKTVASIQNRPAYRPTS